MNIKFVPMVVVLIALVTQGCAGPTVNTKQGSVAGGLMGAVAGGIIGHQSGRGLEGAAIGGGIGALSGGLWGNSIDEQNSYQRRTVIHY